MTLLQILLMTLLYSLAIAVAVCGALGRRWRIRHGRPSAFTLIEPELRHGSPIPADRRKRALRAVKRGTAADDPETARVARMISRQTLHQFGNPWYQVAHPLMTAVQGLLFGGLATINAAGPLRTGFIVCALVLLALAVYQPFHRTRHLNRARRSLELNEPLAARAANPPASGHAREEDQ